MNRKDTFYYIYSIDSLLKKNVRSGIGDVKLTPGVINILDYLGHNEDVIQKDISDHFRQEPATITSALKYMERNGLIKREENRKDNRAKNIYLTEKGKQAQQRVGRLYSVITSKGLDNLSKEEIGILNGLLAKICSNLEVAFDQGDQV
ncbi:MAG: MarR family winged helix-turn-helix transcriptional regulator [Lachnospiraceae bacterium]|nr:MarR family winged helix-turn-helix transcriptional regulator [Lachnospiraceae bacterium]